ncbi:MAG: alpha/beta hydrolase [Methylocystaceae bacterium]|nr:alpha/beta hydrolase [Methylocystaceae bacterium]
MKVLFVHGWSVTDTDTYGKLPEAIALQGGAVGLDIDVQYIWLGRYISFHDEVSMSDVTRAFDQALRDTIGENDDIPKFSCITHSTGGPVLREWVERFYGSENLSACPLKHLVMLSPANHGSPLAALGKKRVGRIKAWFSGVEPGQRILDWLSLGSIEQEKLAEANLSYRPVENGVFPYVITGQTIDKKFYNFLDPYLVEKGSDGVVRVAGANMNYQMIELQETDVIAQVAHGAQTMDVNLLDIAGDLKVPPHIPLGVVPDTSHSGDTIGMMGSVTSPESTRRQVEEIVKCLTVTNQNEYDQRSEELANLTHLTQAEDDQSRYLMIVFSVFDDQGDPIDDFDLFLLGGDGHDPDKLEKGFFVDRQRNAAHTNRLVYYVDYDKITQGQLSGFRVVARPDAGFSFYQAAEYHSNGSNLNEILKPNETFYVKIVLKRRVDENVFRVDELKNLPPEENGLKHTDSGRVDFKKLKPAGNKVK